MSNSCSHTMLKHCFKCQSIKPLSDFYKHAKMADGHLNKCKDCTKSDVSKHRAKNLDFIRQYDRDRGNRQDREYLAAYRQKYPRKYMAQTMVCNAVRDGRLIRPAHCQVCGSKTKPHGHHDDYAKPLEVRWLCAACHAQWHAAHGESPNGGW